MRKFVYADITFIAGVLKTRYQRGFSQNHDVCHCARPDHAPNIAVFAFGPKIFAKRIGINQYFAQIFVLEIGKTKHQNLGTGGSQDYCQVIDFAFYARNAGFVQKNLYFGFKK